MGCLKNLIFRMKKSVAGIIKNGYLYNWYTADDVRNIANTGWSVITRADFITLENYLDNGENADPTRGNLTIRFSPAVDYSVTENLILRLFVDYNQTLPHVPTSFPITRIDGGLTVRFMLN